MDEFPDIKHDLMEMARVRAMISAEGDPNFKHQLFDHEKKLAAMIDMLKTQSSEESFHTD